MFRVLILKSEQEIKLSMYRNYDFESVGAVIASISVQIRVGGSPMIAAGIKCLGVEDIGERIPAKQSHCQILWRQIMMYHGA